MLKNDLDEAVTGLLWEERASTGKMLAVWLSCGTNHFSHGKPVYLESRVVRHCGGSELCIW